MHRTLPLLQPSDFPALRRAALTTLQVNVGYLCNQQCLHCHVNAGPKRTEIMTADTAAAVLEFMGRSGVGTLDLTGGAPELNPQFRTLVETARTQGVHVIDRCNLTVLELPEQADTAAFLAAHQVEITASLPCYLADNVDAQRGTGVFAASLAALRRLNALGYGRPDSDLVLTLVYNPQGPSLPPPQAALEADYRQRLRTEYGIEFTRLFTLANMPIQRFGSTLISKGRFAEYMELLRGAHQADNLAQVMCRSLISIDWRGYVYDCDFNQMLGLPLPNPAGGSAPLHISQLDPQTLTGQAIATAEHCYGCTAGQGSSCGGAL